MAYGFNNDKSKTEVYTRTEIDNTVQSINNAIDDVADGVNSMFVVERVDKEFPSSSTVPGGGGSQTSINIAKTGYTPIGIVGFQSGNSSLVPTCVMLNTVGASSCIFNVQNVTSSAQQNLWYAVDVLYKKNEQ